MASRLILFTCGVVGCTTEFEIERNYPTKQGCRNAVRKSFKFWESRWISTSDRLLLSETATARQARLALRGERTSPRLEIPVTRKRLEESARELLESCIEKRANWVNSGGFLAEHFKGGEDPEELTLEFVLAEKSAYIKENYG